MSYSMSKEKEVMNEIFDSVLVTTGVVLLSMASKKLFKEQLTSAENIKSYVKLAVGISASTLGVRYLQDKKYIPVDPFKSA